MEQGCPEMKQQACGLGRRGLGGAGLGICAKQNGQHLRGFKYRVPWWGDKFSEMVLATVLRKDGLIKSRSEETCEEVIIRWWFPLYVIEPA